MPWEVVPLAPAHHTAEFCCGRNQLDVYIKKWALLNQQEDMGRTFVLVRSGETKVCGYYTISNSKVAKASLPLEEQFSANYPVPTVLIAKLAVDKGEQGKGLGEYLLMDALKRCQKLADQAALRGIEVDAIDDEAERFYLQYGFKRLTDKPLHLYLSLRIVRKLGL